MIKDEVRVHQVVYVRGNRIESVVILTRSIARAHHALLSELKKVAPELVDGVFRDIANEDITTNCFIHVKDDDGEGALVLQLFTWDEPVR